MTSHIYPVTHDVLDKYEIADGVVNEDVTEYQPSKQYDLIFSIVTMQHVDRIKSTRDPKKIMKATENLMKILSPDGTILIFHGLGENKEMDDLLMTGKLEFSQIFYLMKISKYQWAEAKWDDVKYLSYDYSMPTARSVLIAVFVKNMSKQKLFN